MRRLPQLGRAGGPCPALRPGSPSDPYCGASVKGGDEEESEEPPKVVVTEVKEEDAFYSKK